MCFPGGSDGKKSACSAGDLGSILSQEGPLEKGMATHSSIIAWETSCTEEPGGLQSVGEQRVIEHTAYLDFIMYNCVRK